MTNFLDLPKMERITKNSVFAKHNSKESHRKCFSKSGIKDKKKGRGKFFAISFAETIKPIFEKQTGLQLLKGQYYDSFLKGRYNNYYLMIKDDNELRIIQDWEKKQGKRIFLRDCLSLSIALDYNKFDPNTPDYTDLGSLENRAKKKRDREAISQLANEVTRAINDLPFYKDADLICSVPSQPDKGFDSPKEVTRLVRAKIGKQDVTDGFIFGGKKAEATKDILVDKKWENWENAQLSFKNNDDCNVEGKTVILIDDKYQSGITIQYIAMKLQEAGAHQIYGLCFVKALRNDDNRSR